MSIFVVLLLFLFHSPIILAFSSTSADDETKILLEIHRILHKRDIELNRKLDDPNAWCRNGGIYSGAICHCIHPNTGAKCEHFACVHGISVGPRYAQDNPFFNTPCLCDHGWKGDLCEYKPVDKCGGRGEWKNGHCECIGHYFGSECQYTSRCIEGRIKQGRCICNDHFEGDHCDRIKCNHGTPDYHNKSLSCICPKKYKGRHCNECKELTPITERYPVCSINLKMKKTAAAAELLRKQQRLEMRNRVWLISATVSFLLVIAACILITHFLYRNQRKEERDRAIQRQKDRHILLTNEVRLQKLKEELGIKKPTPAEARNLKFPKRRLSEPELTRKDSTRRLLDQAHEEFLQKKLREIIHSDFKLEIRHM